MNEGGRNILRPAVNRGRSSCICYNYEVSVALSVTHTPSRAGAEKRRIRKEKVQKMQCEFVFKLTLYNFSLEPLNAERIYEYDVKNCCELLE